MAAAAARHGVGIAGFRALGGGAVMSAAADTLARHPVAGGAFTRDAALYKHEVDLASKLVKRLGIESTKAMAAVAYRFNITDPRISTTIAGFSELAHLHGAIAAAANGPLPAADWDSIVGAWYELFANAKGRA
jgi:aryl-alcohol dehydrogenase-like predicted oxidoreductase